jgi:uncharacterized membrane protein
VKDVSTMVQPGDSAIFALLRTSDPKVVTEQFQGYGGTILSTTLSRGQQAKVEETLRKR